MATPTLPRNSSRVFKKAMAIIQSATVAASSVGAKTTMRMQRNIWISAGVPASTAPEGMAAKALILDTTNSEVYRYIANTTYVKITATS